ncbi:MAG TPA: cytochrome c [Limnobacter sp.]|nr:cytochrome c [Limnobacter sp.]
MKRIGLTVRAMSAVGLLAGVVFTVPAQAAEGDAKAALAKNSMCIGCHGIPGYKASFPEVYNVPYIAGQNAKYLEAALQAYKKGDRKHPTMRGIAETLTDQDIADLAAYYSQAK